MSACVPDELLQSFVDGDVGEQLAVHIAKHLDDCASCSTRATHMDALSPLFASCDDPAPADDLVMAILAAAEEPETQRLPIVEGAVGAALLAAAAALFVLGGEPVAVLSTWKGLWLGLDAAAIAASVHPLAWASVTSMTVALSVGLFALARTIPVDVAGESLPSESPLLGWGGLR
jgi:predicted anti-sigma-YlaC factor YlaD